MDLYDELVTVKDWLRWGVSQFTHAKLFFGHGSEDALDEAAYLIGYALDLPMAHFDALVDTRLTLSEKKQVYRILERRAGQRIPAAYLTHEAYLGDYKFYVDERVIIPRSFIAELLPDELTPFIGDPFKVKNALDICTGSGCLAILMANAFPNADVVASDISPDALAVAQHNIADYDLSGRVDLVCSDVMNHLPPGITYDVIVSNPPYVTSESMKQLPREYCYEPRIALFGGDNGMDIVQQILDNAAQFLKPEGILVIEVGNNRSFVEDAFPNLPFTWLTTRSSEDSVFLLRREDLAK
jgi:ribosomal protein L3 glutamine methyltransferase